jgi:hypothetical protein
MRPSKLLLAILCCCFAAHAVIAPVSHSAVVEGNGSSSETTAAINTTGATLLVAYISGNAQDLCAYTVTDAVGGTGTGNIWRCAKETDITHRLVALMYSYDSSGGALVSGASHTLTVAWGAYRWTSIALTAWSGTLTTADPLDQTNSAFDTYNHTLASGSITPTVNGELVIAGFTTNSNEQTSFGSSPLTVLVEGLLGGDQNAASIATVIQTTAAAVNNTFTQSWDTSMAVAIVSFKPGSPSARKVSVVVD